MSRYDTQFGENQTSAQTPGKRIEDTLRHADPPRGPLFNGECNAPTVSSAAAGIERHEREGP